jgi:hypothetical protein
LDRAIPPRNAIHVALTVPNKVWRRHVTENGGQSSWAADRF